MKSYVIHLIRHGLSEGNLKGQYIGVTDSPLSAQGAREIHRLKKNGIYPTAQRYFSSPLSRCIETLAILHPKAQPEIIEDFRESSFGEWEGKTAKELEGNPAFQKWMRGESAEIPGGENGGHFMARVCTAFEKLVEDLMSQGNTSALIVTHGGVIMTILTAYGLPKAKFYDWMTDNGCGYSMRITPGLWMRSQVAEVFQKLPIGAQSSEAVDEARQAADMLWGEKEEKSE
ncbi:MAG: histidine phosphatase family protein [Clostridia bacterium]|nr:histidine phosphatase family protein [Clostridia bacterium]